MTEDNAVHDPIVVYGKFYCPYCRKHFVEWQDAVDHIRVVHAAEESAAAVVI